MKGNKRDQEAPRSINTISEFAKHLGLSYCTVSRAINGHPLVNEETRKRVLRGMEETGFRPNPFARSLRGRGMGLIGVCFVGLNIPILNTKIFYLQNFLRRHNLRGLLEIADENPASERRTLSDFLRIRTEGIVLIYSSLSRQDSAQLLSGIPFIHVDPQDPNQIPSVHLDRSKAMALLLRHLLDLGHRRFVLLGITQADGWRWPPLLRLAKEAGLDPDRCFQALPKVNPESSISQGRQLMTQYLRNEPRPATAVIALDDVMALGAMEGLRQAGFRVPEDFSVTGFDHLEVGQELSPSLTTIEQNPEVLMDTAGGVLLDRIAGKGRGAAEQDVHCVEPKIVVGRSTGVAPAR